MSDITLGDIVDKRHDLDYENLRFVIDVYVGELQSRVNDGRGGR